MQQHYKELFHQWKSDEDNIKDELKQIVTNMKEFGTGIREVSSDVKEIGIDVKILTKKLDDLVASTVISASEANNEGEYIKTFNDLVMALRKIHTEKGDSYALPKKRFEFQVVSCSGLLTFLLFQINYILRHPPPMAFQTLPCNGLYLVGVDYKRR